MPGSGRSARIVMAIVAVVVIAGLVVSTFATPTVVGP
jgi:hypothetical protein